MKNLLLLLTIVIGFTAKSQTSVYHPFPTGNANWVYQYYDDFHNPTNYFGSYSITGDTILSGNSYKIISGCAAQFGCNSGALRDSNKVIYFRPDTSSIDYVLYNFNLSLGDTIIHPFGGAICSNDTVTITQVDSVLTSDGYHRVLALSSFATWVEGIGSISYLFQPANVLCLSGNDILQCMITNSGFTYPPGISSCILSISEQSRLTDKFVISPNPFHFDSHLNLDSEFTNSILKIYNTDGLLLREERILNQNSLTLNRYTLNNGIYFLQLISQRGEMKTAKFVVY